MKVILLEDVVGAGGAGDVVEVKNGYARNRLLPAGIAIEANAANMKTLEHRRAKIAAKKAADKEMAQTLAIRIDGKQVDFTAKAGESGKLFGSVTAQEIADALQESLGFDMDRRKLLLDAPLKTIGMHDVKYRIYPEVEATIKVNILSDGAPVPETPEETLKDTYADEDLEDKDEDEDLGGEYVYNAVDDEMASADKENETGDA
jgi:large subunit ribosomal protein L9